jgi:hypothetical protein
MKKLRRVLFLVTIAFVLGGCAAGVTRQISGPGKISPTPEAASQIVLLLTAQPTLASGEDWLAFQEEWQTSMVTATGAAGISFNFANSVESKPSGPATIVNVRVNDFRYVSQAKRYGIGVFSGNAFMDVDAQFTESPSGRQLGTRKYATSSSAWEGIFSAMTPKQVEAVAKEIVREVTSR